MKRDARSRLAAQAAAAGYPPDLLALIANATMPRYQPGQQLDDTQIDQITTAVEVLAQAGYTAAALPGQLADYQRHHGTEWRGRFWTRALRTAAVRYRHPDLYGLSACETDPDRLAQHASRQPAPPSAARAA
jgi:hypothetical protein